MEVSGGDEFSLIDRIGRLFGEPPPDEVWIGDDAAVIAPPAGPLLVAADAMVEGVHFDPALGGLDDVGWKAVAVNVSDIAAMGGDPSHLLVTVAAPAATDLDLLYRGLAEASGSYGCPVVGGDLSDAPVIAVSVTVLGRTSGKPPVLRSGARPGDTIFVTGPLGAASAGLQLLRAGRDGGQAAEAYRRPRARVGEGRAAAAGGATAMIDVSDGLGADLGHILEASGVGAVLGDVPVAPMATPEQAYAGGDDYELVFTAPVPDRVAAAFDEAGLRRPVPIGTCTADRSERPPAGGWRHWS